MQSDGLRRSSKEGRGRKRSFSNMSRSSDVDNTLDIRTKLFTKKARLSITSSSSSSPIDSMVATATQSLEEESFPGTNDPGLSICMSSSRSLDKVDSHIDIGCAELYDDVEAGSNTGIRFPVSGSGIVYCCEETTTVAETGKEAATQSLEEESSPGSGIVYCCEETTAVAEIEQDAPSPDSNGRGSGTCMNEVDFFEKGQHKGLVSSANTNVGKDEVREVDVIS